jgi:hypothetical protein
MSLITKNNYEAYLLDYVEENLPPELVAEFMLFFEKNPELKEELDEFELHELVPLEIVLEDRVSLKKGDKSVALDNYEELIIAEIENENTTKISKELHSFLAKNPNKQADFITYKKTKLEAPVAIFDDKKSLKKKERKVVQMYWWYNSAAAAVIILFLLNVFTNSEQEKLPIANKEEIILPEIDNKEEIFPNELAVDENKVTVVKEKNSIKDQKPKQIIKESSDNFVPEKKKEVVLSDNSNEVIESAIDSILEEIIKELPIEEIQYADNVKITYEDDPAAKVPKAKNRFKTVGQFLTKPLRKKFLTQDVDENGEVTAYAINFAGFSFARNKRKIKN